MEKQNVQAVAVVIFASILATIAMTGEIVEYEEMGLIQDAMRNLRRVDNMMYSCETSILAGSESQVQRVDVWVDQLSGSWVSEYYTIDEDGTRCFLKQFCDGREVYSYIDWNGEWEIQQEADLEAPALDSLTVLDYDSEDITEVSGKNKEGVVAIDYIFTLEYIQNLQKEYADMMEESYQKYVKMQASEDVIQSMEVTAQQYRQTTWEDIRISHTIDSENVICGSTWSMKLTQPEILTDEHGIKSLGEEQALQYDTAIQVLRYNQDGILNKIEQCRNETGSGY